MLYSKNKTKNQLKSIFRHQIVSIDEMNYEDGLVVTDEIENKSITEVLREALDIMGEPDQEIIVRHYYYYRSSTEISEKMGMKSETVKSGIKRAKKKLKKFLQKEGIQNEKTFVFDKSEDELINLDENTILSETGIDAARVKAIILKEIKDEKKTMKTSVKKLFTIVAIAAAIAAAIITVQAATGAFTPAFAELYAGEPANGVFPGANLSVKSDTLDIDFLGITGDETSMISIYDIRKKDGSDFIDTFDTPEDYRFLNLRADINVSENNIKKLKNEIFGGGVEG